jgi:hypothetical protein
MMRFDGTSTILYCYILLLEFEANLKGIIIDDHTGIRRISIASRDIVFVLVEEKHLLVLVQSANLNLLQRQWPNKERHFAAFHDALGRCVALRFVSLLSMMRFDGTSTVLYCYILLLEFKANLKVIIIDDCTQASAECTLPLVASFSFS